MKKNLVVLLIGALFVLFCGGLALAMQEEASIATENAEMLKEKDPAFYDFKLGKQRIDGYTFAFEFPGNMDVLYVFPNKEMKYFNPQELWKNYVPANTKMIINLYDNSHSLISSSEGVRVSDKSISYGSIVFSEITKDNIENVAYFSFVIR